MDSPGYTHDVRNDPTTANRRPATMPCLRPKSGTAEAINQWLLNFPEVDKDRSVIIEAVVDDYLLCLGDNPNLSVSEYCGSRPVVDESLRSSIFKQLEVEWAYQQSHTWPTIGNQLGSFLVIEELGRGAKARVYLCTQPEFGNRQVVVKAERGASIEAFTLGQLRHSNIVPIYSAEVDDGKGLRVLCMPFVGRSTLRDVIEASLTDGVPARGDCLIRGARLKERPSDRPVAMPAGSLGLLAASFYDCVAYIGVRLSAALGHAHAQGVVHGDIKPSNVLITFDGEPLLLDFNLSGNATLQTSANGGTLPYMPPEQLDLMLDEHNRHHRYDERSDVFSLGAVLYEAVTGRAPFSIEGVFATSRQLAAAIIKQQRRGPISLRNVNANVPRSLANVICRCLQWRPDDRIQSASELQAALERELLPVRRLRRRIIARKRTNLAASSIVTIGLCCGAALIALRAPAHVRFYERGLELKQDGRLADARSSFARAYAIQPSFVDAGFEEALAAIQLGQFDEAQKAFAILAMSRRDARSAAYSGYCFDLQDSPLLAIPWYERALELGYDSAGLYNNLAVAYQATNAMPSEIQRKRVQEHLDAALRRMPSDKTVQLNWVRQEIAAVKPQSRPVSEQTIAFAKRLATDFPNAGDVQAMCASALVTSAKPEDLRIAIMSLKRAAELGWAPSRQVVMRSHKWAPLSSMPACEEVIALLDRPHVMRRSPATPRILEPRAASIMQRVDQ